MKTLFIILAVAFLLTSCSLYQQTTYTTGQNPLVIKETTVIPIGPIFNKEKSPSKQRFTIEVKSKDLSTLKIYTMPIHGDRKLFSKKLLYFLSKNNNGYSHAILTEKFLYEDATDVLLIIEGTGTIDDIIIMNNNVPAKPLYDRVFIGGTMYLY